MIAVYRTPTVERTVFATPRAAEFLELRALQAQTGQPVEAFGHVVVKSYSTTRSTPPRPPAAHRTSTSPPAPTT